MTMLFVLGVLLVVAAITMLALATRSTESREASAVRWPSSRR